MTILSITINKVIPALQICPFLAKTQKGLAQIEKISN